MIVGQILHLLAPSILEFCHQNCKKIAHSMTRRDRFDIRCSNGQLDISSNESLLYGYVQGHMTLDDFSWTDSLRSDNYATILVSHQYIRYWSLAYSFTNTCYSHFRILPFNQNNKPPSRDKELCWQVDKCWTSHVLSKQQFIPLCNDNDTEKSPKSLKIGQRVIIETW